jgi:SseB protein C-terminal domain/SseB protein N-terminal domain
MTFEPENPLEDALLRAMDDPAARPAFYSLLMTERLYLGGDLGRTPDDGSLPHLTRDDTVGLARVQYNGREFHPVFTALSRLVAFIPPGTQHFTATGRDLFTCTLGSDFILNPGSDVGKQLLANEIAFWLEPSARARRNLMREQPHAIVTPPEKISKKLLTALSILFASRSEVVAAYLLEVSFSDRAEPPHPLIAIETTGDWGKLFGEVSAINAAIQTKQIVDVARLDRSLPGDGMLEATKAVAPFYQRKITE